MEFIDAKIIYIILHLIGVILGAGGAYVSGFLFLQIIKDRNIEKSEVDIVRTTSNIVSAGIVILVISGALLFALDVPGYLASTKFLAKMSVVAIIIINGIFYHFYHFPKLVQAQTKVFKVREHTSIFISGAVSLVSWTVALILGSLHAVPYSYLMIMLFYVGLLILGVISSLALQRYLAYKDGRINDKTPLF